jgi:hypothetical protein
VFIANYAVSHHLQGNFNLIAFENQVVRARPFFRLVQAYEQRVQSGSMPPRRLIYLSANDLQFQLVGINQHGVTPNNLRLMTSVLRNYSVQQHSFVELDQWLFTAQKLTNLHGIHYGGTPKLMSGMILIHMMCFGEFPFFVNQTSAPMP